MIHKKRVVFLSNISSKNLENLYHIETNVKSKIRLQCAILRKEGKTLEEISSVTKKPKSTIGDILMRFDNKGIIAKDAIKQYGQPKKLSDSQLKKVRLMIGKTRNNCIEADNWNELAVRIDDDSYCEPDYLERLHAIATGQVNKIKSKIPYESDRIFIEKHFDKIGAVGGIVPYHARQIYYRSTKNLRCFDEVLSNSMGEMISHPEFRDSNPTDRGHFSWYEDAVLPSQHIRSSFLYRNSAVKKVGGHWGQANPTGMREEDHLCLILLDKGYFLFSDTGAIAWHLLATGAGARDLAGKPYEEWININLEYFKKWSVPYLKRLY